jgi:hypothetical protein
MTNLSIRSIYGLKMYIYGVWCDGWLMGLRRWMADPLLPSSAQILSPHLVHEIYPIVGYSFFLGKQQDYAASFIKF